ncbi:cytokinin dehydrogenase 1-like [Malania oleifera]|uniref:cytokinin dehydrogenase 1-like n=1 Tax=Malania oleifera TaxID=397392 RepID=UPI0025AE8C74|nr:cytokinin dehydrogenase 1-like [Malania oleifera]
MGSPSYGILKTLNDVIVVLLLSCFYYRHTLCFEGRLEYVIDTNMKDLQEAASDYGNLTHNLPSELLRQASVKEISEKLTSIFRQGSQSETTVAARGNGHSTHGQAQALNGVVIEMQSLRTPKMQVNTGAQPSVDVSGGELWINVLSETLKYGLSPRSWTDYLYLTVGGTLSNAGISGQAFRFGPQIDNVYQLEVVTGRGDIVTCSEKLNSNLFYAVLGGLGQFGIITRAKIAIQTAPQMVKVIRADYSNFSMFSKDQEDLISREDTFDYIEGFALVNATTRTTLYRIELAKYFNTNERAATEQEIDRLLSGLSYIPSTLNKSEATYMEFLDRVHTTELQLQKQGLWEVPHPWLVLMVPKSKIQVFADEVFNKIIDTEINGPLIIYPVNTSKWKKNTSLVTPDESVIYLVSILSAVFPSSTTADSLQRILAQNQRILDFCETAQLGTKQYLGFEKNQSQWQAHFGPARWEAFKRRKSIYDPLAILAPGQGIFTKGEPIT